MKQEYKAKIEKPYKDEDDWDAVTQTIFSHDPFQHYIRYFNDITRNSPEHDAGSTRENIVRDLHRIKGYNVVKLSKNTLLTGVYSGARSEEIPDVVRLAIERKLDRKSYEIDDVARNGIPDFIVFKLPMWHELSTMLHPIKSIDIDDSSRTISVKSSYSDHILSKLVKSMFFVEVKSWSDYLTENQEEWFDKYGEILDARIFSIKHLEKVDDEYDDINLETPWEEGDK